MQKSTTISPSTNHDQKQGRSKNVWVVIFSGAEYYAGDIVWCMVYGEYTHKRLTPWDWSDFTAMKHMKIEFIVPVVNKFRDSEAFY